MKLNIVKKIRMTTEMNEQIKEVSEATGFQAQALIRYLLGRSLTQLRGDCQGDYSKLEFTLRR